MSAGETRPSSHIPALSLAPSLQISVLVACGVIASGAFVLDGLMPLRVVTAWLAADAALGCVLTQLIALKLTQARARSTRDESRTLEEPLHNPEANANRRKHRLATTINHWLSDWEPFTWPELGRRALSAWVAAGLVLVLGTYLGRWELALLSGALALAGLLTLIMGKHVNGLERLLEAVQAIAAVTLGYLIVAPPNWLTGCLAGMAAVWAYLGATWRQTGARSALQATGLGYLVAVGLMLWARQPVPAGAIATLGLMQVLGAREELPSKGRIHLQKLAWLGSILLLSLASTHWIWAAA